MMRQVWIVARVAGGCRVGTDSAFRFGSGGLVGGSVRAGGGGAGVVCGHEEGRGCPLPWDWLVVTNYRVRSSGQDVPQFGFQVVG